MNVANIRVAAVVDDYTLVLNKGAADGLKQGQRFLTYGVGEEIKDPVSGENLGKLKLVRGTGKVVHLQDHMATIESDMRGQSRRIITKPPQISSTRPAWWGFSELMRSTEFREVEEIEPAPRVPFHDPEVGDHADRFNFLSPPMCLQEDVEYSR